MFKATTRSCTMVKIMDSVAETHGFKSLLYYILPFYYWPCYLTFYALFSHQEKGNNSRTYLIGLSLRLNELLYLKY